MPRSITSLRDIVDRYDLYLFDQWGVIHNGRTLYPNVLDTLKQLRAVKGKTLLILSNSSKNAAHSAALMQQMGLDPALFDQIITSGEHFLQCLREKSVGIYRQLGKRYYGIHWPEGYSLPKDLPCYRAVETLQEADFILLTGLSQPVEDYRPILGQALELGLPMICANPDLLSPEGGELKPCPGKLAAQYRAMGGNLVSHGKPDKSLYDMILQQFPHPQTRIIAIGDSLDHDIQGANLAGIASWFLTQGVHQPAWRALRQQHTETDSAKLIAAQHKVHIDYVSHGLGW